VAEPSCSPWAVAVERKLDEDELCELDELDELDELNKLVVVPPPPYIITELDELVVVPLPPPYGTAGREEIELLKEVEMIEPASSLWTLATDELELEVVPGSVLVAVVWVDEDEDGDVDNVEEDDTIVDVGK